MKERYGKFVLIGMLLIGLYYFFTIQGGISNWYSTRDYYQSDTFSQEYKTVPNSYVEKWEDNQPVYYENLEEYIKENSYLFYSVNQPEATKTKRNKAISPNTNYSNFFMSEGTFVFLIAFFLLGFLLFFVDLKTNFNTFLFSLGVTRTAIFKEKLKTTALPLFGVLLLCKLAFIASLYLFIPHEFINVHLSTLFLTLMNGYILTIFFFACGIFIGILTGNLIFGPLIAVVFLLSTQMVNAALTNYLLVADSIMNDTRFYDYYSNYQMQLDIGKGNISFATDIAAVAGCILLLWISLRVFNQISLEKSSQNILLDKYRLPITILIIVYSCFVVWGIGFLYPLYNYSKPQVLRFISKAFISGLMISAVTAGTIYFVPIKNRVFKWREKHRQFKEFKLEE